MTIKEKPMRAYWFGEKLGYGDGRIPSVGVTHTVEVVPVLCERGLHASVRVLDALNYARCSRLWLVEIGGDVIVGWDKVVGTSRTYLASIDADCLLREFARWCASQVLHIWDAPKGVKDYLATGNPSMLSEALSEAESEAKSAARSVVWVAAWSAARSAARSEAWDAAWSEAWSAAWFAARSAAWSAARSAAWDAAWAEAWSAMHAKLDEMVKNAFNGESNENAH